MSSIKLDHFITSADTDNIDTYLAEYRAGGFLVSEQTVRHHPGLRNGFVRIGPEYLEFMWVEDEEQFEAGADRTFFTRVRELRAAHHPFAFAVEAEDVRALREEWLERGYELPPAISGAARDSEADAPPIWTFQPIPVTMEEGAFCFALTYHTRPKDAPRKVEVAPNSTYAITGVTFASDKPLERATAWRDLLAPGAEIKEDESGQIYEGAIKPHFALWMKPEEYQDHYGLSYKASPHPYGELAVMHLLARDLDKAEEMIGEMGSNAARLPDKRTGIDTLFVPPDERDGFTFAITERPVEEWLRERVALTGERLEVEETG